MGIAPGSQTLWRYVAEKNKTLLAPSGYTVIFTNYPDETSLRSAFVGGKIDVLASLVPTIASLDEAGLAVQLFAPIAWLHEGYPFIAPKTSPIKGLHDFIGKRIGTYPMNHPGMAYWRALFLATIKLNLTSLNPIQSLEPDRLLIQKQVDVACMGGAQWATLQSDTAYHKITDIETTWREYSGSNRLLVYGGYIARRDFIKQHSKFVNDFIKVNQQALQEYKSNRSAFLSVTASYAAGPRMTAAANQAQATYLGYDLVTPDRVYLTDHDVNDYQRLFTLMAQAGYLPKAPKDIGSLFYVAPAH